MKLFKLVITFIKEYLIRVKAREIVLYVKREIDTTTQEMLEKEVALLKEYANKIFMVVTEDGLKQIVQAIVVEYRDVLKAQDIWKENV